MLGEPFQPSVVRALEFLASQFVVMGPVVFSIMMLAIVRFRSMALVEQDRLMLAFFIVPVAAVTLFAIYARAYPNWASPSIVPALVASAAILVRLGWRYWLWGSLALGVLLQSALLVTDAIATRLPLQAGKLINPYERVLGWREYAEHVGKLATTLGAQAIATDDRRSFDTLRYYWRNRPQAVVSWGVANEPLYDLTHPLNGLTREPVLFVTWCPDVSRLNEFYSVVEPMGVFPEWQDRPARHFLAFRLSQGRVPIGPLQPCRLADQDTR